MELYLNRIRGLERTVLIKELAFRVSIDAYIRVQSDLVCSLDQLHHDGTVRGLTTSPPQSSLR